MLRVLLLETMKLPEDTTPKLRVYIRLSEINISGLWIFDLACMSKNHIQSHQRNHKSNIWEKLHFCNKRHLMIDDDELSYGVGTEFDSVQDWRQSSSDNCYTRAPKKIVL